ncbi:hypothetical protein A5672_03065 [Mycobacterium alsense]|uniref:Transposase n=1 Tax=Mycobacterium alsense TaxID=324058 RepID=A0ABD6NUM9_9MYCO|nr:hypothetical protein A5672_03065 [Mycobacterium alsense]
MHLAPKQSSDQKTRDHKEHVHTDETAMHPRHLGVKKNYGHHRNSAQALDVGTKSRWFRALSLHALSSNNAVGLVHRHLPKKETRSSIRRIITHAFNDGRGIVAIAQ